MVLSDDPGLLGPHHGSSPRAPAAGWSRCGWCPRASTCPGWRSASTPPARRRRCSSRRRSAGSCGRGGPARRRASSCRRCPTCCSWPARWRPSATTCSASRTASRRTIRWTPNCAEQRRDRAERLDNGFESLGADAELDQVIFDGSSFGTATPAGSDEEADYLGIPGPARRRPDARPAAAAARKSSCRSAPRRASVAAGRRRTASCANCAANSTRWCRWRTTAPGKPHGWIHNELRRLLRRPADGRRDPRSAAGPHRGGARPEPRAVARQPSACSTGSSGRHSSMMTSPRLSGPTPLITRLIW